MILLVNELFEGHYLIHKHQPHIGTYMGGCHFPAQYVTSLHSILVGEQLLNRQFPALSKTAVRKKEEMAALTVSYSTLCYTGVITRPRYLQE